ncbi:MAG: FAD-dependent oxidoreductase [Candidatus Brockarchaeota archaeon]|nr:FAD-dependent oxidoreductase [Candidatus Brockarchaeota archaeon]
MSVKAVKHEATRVGVLGGGLSGIAYAYFSSRMGFDVTVLEKNSVPGGLMRSIVEEGFTFDIGGSHIIFSKDTDVLSFMLSLLRGNRIENRRNTAILYKGRLVKYPFENGLSDLPFLENLSCLLHFLYARIWRKREPGNLREFFYNSLGSAISEKYLIPYNEKIWKMSIEDMSLGFIGRIPNPKVLDVVKASLGIGSEGYVHQLFFHYPRKGGIQALIESLKSSVQEHVVTGFEAKNAENESGEWVVSNGHVEKVFDRIVSTIPLHDAVRVFNAPRYVKSNVERLRFNSLVTVAIGLEELNVKGLSWLYIPDRNIHPHRVSFPSNFSPENAPEGKSSILAEITVKPDDRLLRTSCDEVASMVIEELDKLKIISKNKVVYRNVFQHKYAYPILDSNYQECMERIRAFFNEIGVELIGRFAEFKYINMDDAIRNVANRLGIHKVSEYA